VKPKTEPEKSFFERTNPPFGLSLTKKLFVGGVLFLNSTKLFF